MKNIVVGSFLGIFLVTSSAFGQTVPVTTSAVPSDIACVSPAVEARESAIASAWNNFSTSMTNALSARKTALVTAWSTADGRTRRSLRNEAWKTYREASRNAHSKLKTDRKTAWDAYKIASRACNVPVVEAQGADAAGTIGL